MAMGGGGRAGAVSEINVTPLIDVLLVLLIIFMVIIPLAPHGLAALVPQPSKLAADDPRDTDTIVVSILLGERGEITYKINEDHFSGSEVEPKLASIFATRQEKVMFVKGDSGVRYGDVAEMIDLGRQAGVDNIGIITPKIEAGR
jgi:biopolymer transport protein ExbD/biopolymer transport protein TolR